MADPTEIKKDVQQAIGDLLELADTLDHGVTVLKWSYPSLADELSSLNERLRGEIDILLEAN